MSTEQTQLEQSGRLTYRRRPCNGCAFLPTSPERQDKEWWERLLLSCCHRPFICHKSCFQLDGGQWNGEFDPTRKPDGSPAERGDHMLCAGFAKMFGEDLGIDPATIEGVP